VEVAADRTRKDVKYLVLILLAITCIAGADKKPARVPVTISVRHIANNEIYFQPMIAPTFEGLLVGTPKGKISKCFATMAPVAELKDGGLIQNLVLDCGDGVQIFVKAVDFE
jgi:hypothetical protein